jgi:ferredoxin-type protein NapF
MTDLTRRSLLFGRSEPDPTDPIVIGKNCLAIKGVYCRSCAECCPQAAISIRPVLGGSAEVSVDGSACSLCGECLSVCPASAIASSLDMEAAHA